MGILAVACDKIQEDTTEDTKKTPCVQKTPTSKDNCSSYRSKMMLVCISHISLVRHCIHFSCQSVTTQHIYSPLELQLTQAWQSFIGLDVRDKQHEMHFGSTFEGWFQREEHKMAS